jgi:aminoglycoside phosphotransferase family enzyme
MEEVKSDQASVLDFMATPEAYDSAPEQIVRIETHASVVFLAGTRAYKVKRAVKYPFLDFSTLERTRS